MTPKKPEERIAALEERSDAQKEVLDQLRDDVRGLPAAIVAQIHPLIAEQAKRNRGRIRAHERRLHSGAGGSGQAQGQGQVTPMSWPETLKQAVIGLSILGMLLGSAYYGAKDRMALSATTEQSQTQTGSGK